MIYVWKYIDLAKFKSGACACDLTVALSIFEEIPTLFSPELSFASNWLIPLNDSVPDSKTA